MGHVLARGSADHPIEGATVGMEGPVSVSALRIGTEMGYERLSSASGERLGVGGMDVTLRAGLVFMLLDKPCPDFCPAVKPWVDFCPSLGAGLASTGDLDMIGHGVGGGWLDVRLSKASSYPVMRLELQHDMYSSRVEGNTQFVVGLGWVEWDISAWGEH